MKLGKKRPKKQHCHPRERREGNAETKTKPLIVLSFIYQSKFSVEIWDPINYQEINEFLFKKKGYKELQQHSPFFWGHFHI